MMMATSLSHHPSCPTLLCTQPNPPHTQTLSWVWPTLTGDQTQRWQWQWQCCQCHPTPLAVPSPPSCVPIPLPNPILPVAHPNAYGPPPLHHPPHLVAHHLHPLWPPTCCHLIADPPTPPIGGRVLHRYGNTHGVFKMGNTGTNMVLDFNTPWHTVYPYRSIVGMHRYITAR